MSRQNMFYWQSDRQYTQEQINEIFLKRERSFSRDQIIYAIEKSLKIKVEYLDQPINQGSVNLVCPYTLKNGSEGVIRAHPPAAKNMYFHVEQQAMKVALEHGIPTAEVLVVDDSRHHVPFDFMLMRKVPGKVLRVERELHPSQHSSYLVQIGQQLGKLHKIKTSGFGFFNNELAKKEILEGQYQSNQQHFLSAIDLDELYHLNEDTYFDPKLIKQGFNILRINASTANCPKPVLIHNDIADWNTIVSNGKISGIMDWDECFSGDPVFEFATLSLFYDDEQMQQVLAGYCDLNKLPVDFSSKYPLYTLRYILNKSKIALTKIKYAEKTSMHTWLTNANSKLIKIVKELS